MTRFGMFPVLLAALVIAAGCSSNKESVDKKGSAAQPAPMQTAQTAQSGQQTQQTPQMPPGHPQVAPAPVDPHPATDTVEGLTWDVPPAFEKVTPSSNMRAAQYKLLSGKTDVKDGELAVFFFGAGMGGGTQANLERWANQFQQNDKSDPMKAAKTGTFNDGALKVTTIEVGGRYVSSMMGGGPSYDEPGWKLFGAVVEGNGGPWFFKAAGPAAVMDKNHGTILKMYQGMRSAK